MGDGVGLISSSVEVEVPSLPSRAQPLSTQLNFLERVFQRSRQWIHRCARSIVSLLEDLHLLIPQWTCAVRFFGTIWVPSWRPA